MASKPATMESQKARICELIAEGTPLRVICRMDGMPAWRTVYDWLRADEEFSKAMDIARDIGADAIAQEALEIADTPHAGERIEKEGEKVTKVVVEDMLGHRKLQIETRLKLLAKWHPKRYGERLTAEHTGADGSPLTIQIVKFGDSNADDSAA